MRSSDLRHSPPRIRAFLLTLGLGLMAVGAVCQAGPPSRSLRGRLEIRLPTSIFERDSDLLSAVAAELPMRFPDFDLGLMRAGFSSPLAELGPLNVRAARQVSAEIRRTDLQAIERAGLLGEMPVLDAQEFRIVRLESDGYGYLAIKPSRRFASWQRAFSGLLAKRLGSFLPEAKFVGAGERPSEPAIPLLRWKLDEVGKAISEARIADSALELATLFRDQARRISAEPRKAGQRSRSFDLSDQSVDLSRKKHMGDASQALTAFRYNPRRSRMVSTEIMEWAKGRRVPEPGYDVFPDAPKTESSSPVDSQEFAGALPAPLRVVYLRESAKIGAGFRPRRVLGDESGLPLYVMEAHHPMLAPAKARKVSRLLEDLGTPKSERTSAGYAIYGSYPRAEFERPSDADLLMNVTVRVPDSIRTREQAEAYVARAFMEDVMDHFRKQADQRKVAFIEGRVGSDATMKLPVASANPLVAYNNNPYLSHQEIMSGRHRDPRSGREYSLEELVRLGDFTKFKLDYFRPQGAREEVSLQFVIGYEWQGNGYLLRRHGFKGAISTLLPTAVYYGAESYAVGAALVDTVSTYASQFGDPVARSIGELMEVSKFAPGSGYADSEPMWRAKILKRFYASLGFMHRGARAGLDRLFYEGARDYLAKHGDVSVPQLSELIQQLVVAVNQPQLEEMNAIKRIANDFKELNERDQALTNEQWQSRADEFRTWRARLEASFPEERMPPALRAAIRVTDRIIEDARASGSLQGTNEAITEIGQPRERRKAHAAFESLENELLKLEGRLVADPEFSSKALPRSSQALVKTMVALMPHLYVRHSEARRLHSAEELRNQYSAMGVMDSPAAHEKMRQVSRELMNLNPVALGAEQREIFENAAATPKRCLPAQLQAILTNLL